MIRILLQCHIPGLQHLSGEREIADGTLVAELLAELGCRWEQAALVQLNGRSALPSQPLRPGDEVALLVPLNGGRG